MTSKTLSGVFLSFLEFLTLVYLSLFFLTLGSDFSGQIHLRIYTGFFLMLYFIALRIKHGIRRESHWVAALFGAFILFLLLRFGWAWISLALGGKPTAQVPLVSYSEFPVQWVLCFFFFWISFLLSRDSNGAFHRMKWMAWAGFLIAANAVPMLLMNPKVLEGGPTIVKFSHPIFFRDWVAKYLISNFANPNYTGDVMAFGFFPALGITIYLYFYIRKKHSMPELELKQPIVQLFLYGLFALVTSAAIWLFFSRGTILCFVVSTLLYFLFISLKLSSSAGHRFVVSFIAIAVVFLIWAGNFHRVIEELGTLGQEVNSDRITSFAHNAEGSKRAMRIAKDYPVWGVGSGNYHRVSELYATPGSEDQLVLANFHAMCFYLQLIAEEGIGAYLFFLFLLGFFAWSTYRLIQTKSYLRFIAGLSFLMPSLMVLMHASFNYLMQRFSMTMLVLMSLGAAMGILSQRSAKQGEDGGI